MPVAAACQRLWGGGQARPCHILLAPARPAPATGRAPGASPIPRNSTTVSQLHPAHWLADGFPTALQLADASLLPPPPLCIAGFQSAACSGIALNLLNPRTLKPPGCDEPAPSVDEDGVMFSAASVCGTVPGTYDLSASISGTVEITEVVFGYAVSEGGCTRAQMHLGAAPAAGAVFACAVWSSAVAHLQPRVAPRTQQDVAMPTNFTFTCGGTAQVVKNIDIPDSQAGSYPYRLTPPIRLSGGASCTLAPGGTNPSADALLSLLQLKSTPLPPSPPPARPPLALPRQGSRLCTTDTAGGTPVLSTACQLTRLPMPAAGPRHQGAHPRLASRPLQSAPLPARPRHDPHLAHHHPGKGRGSHWQGQGGERSGHQRRCPPLVPPPHRACRPPPPSRLPPPNRRPHPSRSPPPSQPPPSRRPPPARPPPARRPPPVAAGRR